MIQQLGLIIIFPWLRVEIFPVFILADDSDISSCPPELKSPLLREAERGIQELVPRLTSVAIGSLKSGSLSIATSRYYFHDAVNTAAATYVTRNVGALKEDLYGSLINTPRRSQSQLPRSLHYRPSSLQVTDTQLQ